MEAANRGAYETAADRCVGLWVVAGTVPLGDSGGLVGQRRLGINDNGHVHTALARTALHQAALTGVSRGRPVCTFNERGLSSNEMAPITSDCGGISDQVVRDGDFAPVRARTQPLRHPGGEFLGASIGWSPREAMSLFFA